MPLESEYLKEINDDLYYEPDRALRSAPAAVYYQKNNCVDPDLFTSNDLVLVSRVTKTAPALKSRLDDELASYFPEMSWMVSNQNRRLLDLMNYDESESKSLAKSENYQVSEQTEQLRSIFNNDIVEITRLIELSKHVLQGRSDDKFSDSLLTLNEQDNTSKSSQGYNGSFPPIIAHKTANLSRGFRARRSVRDIADQVSRKIKQLKADPLEYKLLQKKIGKNNI
jgi:hypothetical protein